MKNAANMKREEIRDILVQNGLKVTPQRVAVLEAINTMRTHPTAENLIDFIRENDPNVATGTVYNILETFVEKGIIRKVKTDRDVMRYDAIMDVHHHLYCAESDRIEDYYDEELDRMLEAYFREKKIPGFSIRDVKLQLIGNFKGKKEKK